MVDYYPLKRVAGTHKVHDAEVRTVCRECTAGCGLLAYLKEGKIVDIQGDETDPISRGRLCARGIAFHQGLTSPDRLNRVLQRNNLNDSFQPIDDWEKALDLVAEQLRKIRARYGPRSLMIGCDPEAGLDFFIGAMRFARLWGTPHVFHPLYAPRGISSQHYDISASAPRCSDWVHSGYILLVEADLATTHPVTFGWLMDAKDRGAEIISLDSRFNATMSKADVAMTIRPESGNKFALALMKVMLEENLYDTGAAGFSSSSLEAWRDSFASLPYSGLEETTGLSNEKVKEIARRLATKKPVTLITGKRLSNRQNSGIWRTIALAAGWNKMKGGGWYPLDGGLPPFNPFSDIDAMDSRRPVSEDDERFSEAIDELAEVPQDPELPVKALICSGNCLYDFMSPLRSIAKSSELTIHFGAFPNETGDLSHVVIPATLWPEIECLNFSNDRAIQWGERIVEPVQGLRSGLDLWTGVAQRLADARRLEWKAFFPWKKEDGSTDHRSFFGWLLDQSPYTSGYGLERIIAASTDAHVLWPIDPIAAAGTPGEIEPFFAPSSLEHLPPEAEAELFPLTFHATRTISRSGDADNFRPWTKALEDPDAVQIHPGAAKVLGIENGDEVVVHGPNEVIEAKAWITRMVPKWMIWSARRLGTRHAVIYKKGESGEEASRILREFLR